MISIQTIKTTFKGETVETINARELHKWLESKQDFSTWIKRRIKQCNFIENVDFVSLHQKVERETGPHPEPNI